MNIPDGPFNTPPGTTWRQLDPPPRLDDDDDAYWLEHWMNAEPEDNENRD